MTERASMSILVLFEDEIRTAARALALARKLSRDEPESEDCALAWTAAMTACMVALNRADDPNETLVLATKAALFCEPLSAAENQT